MPLALNQLDPDFDDYPSGNGVPMTESDPMRDDLIYSVEALSLYFQPRSDIDISGNLISDNT